MQLSWRGAYLLCVICDGCSVDLVVDFDGICSHVVCFRRSELWAFYDFMDNVFGSALLFPKVKEKADRIPGSRHNRRLGLVHRTTDGIGYRVIISAKSTLVYLHH